MAWEDDAELLLEKEQEDREKLSDTTTWKPKEGDVLIGTLLEGKILDGEYGPCHIMNIEDKDGKVWTVWAGNKLLKDAVIEQAPKVGKGVSVKFDGMKQPSKPGGREYKAFYMACQESDHGYWKGVQEAFYNQNPDGSTSVPAADGLEDPF